MTQVRRKGKSFLLHPLELFLNVDDRSTNPKPNANLLVGCIFSLSLVKREKLSMQEVREMGNFSHLKMREGAI
jgi:hypothetical protein